MNGDFNASGSGTGLRGYGGMVVDASKHLAKAPAYMVFACCALALLGFAAYHNHEPIALAVSIVVTAVFGTGLGKTYVDQMHGNGNRGVKPPTMLS